MFPEVKTLQAQKKSLLSELTELKRAVNLGHDIDVDRLDELDRELTEANAGIEIATQAKQFINSNSQPAARHSAAHKTQSQDSHMISFPAPRVQDRNKLPEVEIKGHEYKSLRSDGYTDSLLQGVSSKAYLAEFTEYLASGGRKLGTLVSKGMTESGAGGVLVPVQWGELITNPPMSSRLRSAVNNKSVSGLLHKFPRLNTSDSKYPAAPVTVSWGGETPDPAGNPDQGSNVNTTNIDIQVNEVYCQGVFSISLLEDALNGFTNYIPQMFQETLDVNLDSKIIAGTGTTVPTAPQPWGLNETGVVPTRAALTNTGIAYKDLTGLLYNLPQQYRDKGAFLLNSNTLGKIADIVDGQGRPLFIPNYGAINQMPGGGTMWSNGTILGRPYIISEFMPDIAADTVSVYYADFEKLYILLNRVGATVRVLDQIQYTSGNYVYALRARFGGRVVQPYAGLGLKHPV